jgi:hypothetical protein
VLNSGQLIRRTDRTCEGNDTHATISHAFCRTAFVLVAGRGLRWRRRQFNDDCGTRDYDCGSGYYCGTHDYDCGSGYYCGTYDYDCGSGC